MVVGQRDNEATRRRGDKVTHYRFVIIPILVLSTIALSVLWGSVSRAETPGAPPLQGDADAGRQVYVDRCASCHGDEGDGAGPAAEFLDPKPRDFRRALYRIHTTPSGQLPTDQDMFQVIEVGMPGTSMPGWADVLTTEEIGNVVAYIKTFSRRFERGEPEPIQIGEPIPSSEESIQTGQEIYARVECNKCHGEQGRGDGPSAPTLETQEGFPIWPADLTKPWRFKGGHEPGDIYRAIHTGFTGTPMPSSEDILTQEETWHLVNYVRSLFVAPDQPELKAVIRAHWLPGTVPDSPDDPIWGEVESFYFPLVGQIMDEPRHFTPMISDILVQAVYNDRALALRLVWNDPTKSPINEDEVPLPDAVAVQFPTQLTGGLEKPRFVSGDLGNPVNLWYWEGEGDTVQEQAATGLATEGAQPLDSQGVSAQSTYDNGQWRVVIRRPLTTDDETDIQFETGQFIPIAFHAWDGSNGEAGGERSLSAWYFIFLAEPSSPIRYAWVPIMMLAAVVVEGGVLWWARRNQ